MVLQQPLDELVDSVAARMGRSVTLDDVYGRVLAYNTSQPTTDRARIDAIMMKVVPDEVRAWEIEAGSSAKRRPFIQPGNAQRGYLPRLGIPLAVRGVRVGCFWVLARDAEDGLDALLAEVEDDIAGVERWAHQVAAALLDGDETRRDAAAAFRSVLLGQVGAVEVAGLREVLSGQAVVIAVDIQSVSASDDSSRLLLAIQAGADAVRRAGGSSALHAEPDHVVMVVPAASDPSVLVQRFVESLRHRSHCDVPGPGADPRYGVSGQCGAIEDLPRAYGEAVTALQAAAVDGAMPGHRIDGTGIYRLLTQVRSTEGFNVLDALVRTPSGENHLALLERVYDFNGPMRALADELHMHRTSLYNRLQRIEQVIGADPLASQTRLLLHAAIKLRRWEDRPRYALHEQWSRREAP